MKTKINEKKYMDMNNKNLFVFISSKKRMYFVSKVVPPTNKWFSCFCLQHSTYHQCLFIQFIAQMTITLA
jgi:hypothetical protein